MSQVKTLSDDYFTSFNTIIDGIPLPEKFTFPFAYKPHPLSIIAAEEVQSKLALVKAHEQMAGKMFGVLVVQKSNQELGYLVAFSGQDMDQNYELNFVPPIADRLQEDGFFNLEKQEILQLNSQIKDLEHSPEYLTLIGDLERETALAAIDIQQKKEKKQLDKAARKEQRKSAGKELSPENLALLEVQLKNESIEAHYIFNRLKADWKEKINHIHTQLETHQSTIENLKKVRRSKSGDLQQKLFDQYQFLNIKGDTSNLTELFKDLGRPPSGAGDCAAPKLLQYAFKHQLHPLAMAEFWWGKPPKLELRKQGRYYPACSGKCKPILSHMLDGIKIESDPLSNYSTKDLTIELVFEDQYLLVINKPAGLLSVPSKDIKDSVLNRIKEQYPEATGPLLVHRLDKLTSGLMVIAKSEEIYKATQSQFIDRTIKKSYIAILDGIVKTDEGFIDLPLSVDEENRPMQKVCYEQGKPASTHWLVLERKSNRTRVHFTPITGRTHQLRVHAAHHKGLNTPIVGDILYGTRSNRLYLHASALSFVHPINEKILQFESKPAF